MEAIDLWFLQVRAVRRGALPQVLIGRLANKPSPFTVAGSRPSSCACVPAALLWWPSQTPLELHPWSLQSTPGSQRH